MMRDDSTPRWSRRVVLTAAAATAGASLVALPRSPLVVLVPSALDAAFVTRLSTALRATLGQPVEPLAIASLREVPEAVSRARDTLFTFAGPALEREVSRVLDGRRHIRLSFGTQLQRPDPTAHAHLSLTAAFERAGRWAATRIGVRAAIITTPVESLTDLAFAFRHGFESAGGECAHAAVVHPGATVDLPRAEVVLALATGHEATRMLRSVGSYTPVITHEFAQLTQQNVHVVSTGTRGEPIMTLARQAHAVLSGVNLELPAMVSNSTTTFALDDTPASASQNIEWALKTGSSFPYTGC